MDSNLTGPKQMMTPHEEGELKETAAPDLNEHLCEPCLKVILVVNDSSIVNTGSPISTFSFANATSSLIVDPSVARVISVPETFQEMNLSALNGGGEDL